jgi:DNA-binding beta-propeller fold protein YncE
VGEPFLPRHRRAAITLSGLALITVVLSVIAGCQSSQQPARPSWPSQQFAPPFPLSQQSAPPSPPSQTVHNSQPPKTVYKSQVELPFTGLSGPRGVAVDSAGNVYVTDRGPSRVLKLPAGSSTPVELPFIGLHEAWLLAVDAAGTVYVTDCPRCPQPPPDAQDYRVLKLPAGSSTPVVLPFTGLHFLRGVAVDSAGNVYVADFGNSRVLKLPGVVVHHRASAPSAARADS